MIERLTVAANGLRMNVLRAGRGPVLLLLHGWPEFSAVWKHLIARLADEFTLVAPDFRGFGDSDNPHPGPSTEVNAALLATDVAALADELGLTEPFGIVSHDIGAQVAQTLALRVPERLSGLFFFNCPYHGIGDRWREPEHLGEIWYQSFHQLPLAVPLVGQSRESIRTYIGWFLRHWSANPAAFDDDLELWVDNFAKPGNLQGGFNWYIGNARTRLAVMKGDLPKPPLITVPARVLWGARDPVVKAEWADRLPEYFAKVEVSVLPDAGHFVHYEQPEAAAREIRRFFAPLPDAS